MCSLGLNPLPMWKPTVLGQALASTGPNMCHFNGVDSGEMSEEEFVRRRRQRLTFLYPACCSSSNRTQQRTLRFLKSVEECDDETKLWAVSRKWEPLDTELARAGLLARGEHFTGEIAVWSLYQWRSKLMSLRFDGDLDLDNLDAILATFQKEPDDDLLVALPELHLRKVKH